MNPGSEASQGDKDVCGRVLPTDRSDVQVSLSMMVSWIAMLSFPPTLVVVGALMLKRWNVQ